MCNSISHLEVHVDFLIVYLALWNVCSSCASDAAIVCVTFHVLRCFYCNCLFPWLLDFVCHSIWNFILISISPIALYTESYTRFFKSIAISDWILIICYFSLCPVSCGDRVCGLHVCGDVPISILQFHGIRHGVHVDPKFSCLYCF